MNKKQACRLPFGLCKKYGIEIQNGWTPADAWQALQKATGKSILQICNEMSTDELKQHAVQVIYPKDDKHPADVSSAVANKISTVYDDLENKDNITISIYANNCVYLVRLYNSARDYDYDILRRMSNE